MNETELYKELGILTKEKERWKDIPENMIAVGSPAKVIRSIFD